MDTATVECPCPCGQPHVMDMNAVKEFLKRSTFTCWLCGAVTAMEFQGGIYPHALADGSGLNAATLPVVCVNCQSD